MHVTAHIKIHETGGPFLGKGRIILMENIIKFGSIAKGAAAMSMSYRKAWQLVEEMNRYAREPLVIKRLGGKDGGGAEVSEAGKLAIKKFYLLESELHRFLEQKLIEIDFSALTDPKHI